MAKKRAMATATRVTGNKEDNGNKEGNVLGDICMNLRYFLSTLE